MCTGPGHGGGGWVGSGTVGPPTDVHGRRRWDSSTAGPPTDVHGRSRWDSSTAGPPTDVQGGRGKTAAPPDRRLSCLRVGEG